MVSKLVPIILAIFIIFFVLKSLPVVSNFNETLSSPASSLTDQQPNSFPPIDSKVPEFIPLEPPVVPEEIGLSQVYPQGAGVGMSKLDSNSFTPGNPLLTDYTIPEAYGESSLTNPYGVSGADQGARIIKIQNVGSQLNFKPTDEAENQLYSTAYSTGIVEKGFQLINGSTPINYLDGYVPENNLKLQASPGQDSTLPNCESTYPNTVKYNNSCITEGDIPYGKVVDGKVNPRLVSRWQSYTGDYSREEALDPIDGTLYPSLK